MKIGYSLASLVDKVLGMVTKQQDDHDDLQTQVDGKALVTGNSSQAFFVATTTTDTHAVNKLQMDNALALRAIRTGDVTVPFYVEMATEDSQATTKLQVETLLTGKASVGGSVANTFKVATAVAPEDAVNLGQLSSFGEPIQLLLPFVTTGYASGVGNTPEGKVWADFKRIELIVLNSDIVGSSFNSATITKEMLQAWPTTWQAHGRYYDGRGAWIRATSATEFTIGSDGSGRVLQVLGYL